MLYLLSRRPQALEERIMFQVFVRGNSRKRRAYDSQRTALLNGSSNGEAPVRHVHVAILGTGFAGLGMAIRLKQDGDNDFVVLERATEIEGTWCDNTYPGCACDIPSHLYYFSFALNLDWSRAY